MRELGKLTSDNTQTPSLPKMESHDKNIVENFADNIKSMLSVIGLITFPQETSKNKQKSFESAKDNNKKLKYEDEEVFYCKNNNGADAKGKPTPDGGFVVLKDSRIDSSETYSFPDSKSKDRKERLARATRLDEKSYKLNTDEPFKSPSGAANFVLGREANGRTEWKNKKGETLQQIEEKSN